MKIKRPAKTAAEFDERFDRGEDIHDLVDLSKARITHPGPQDYNWKNAWNAPAVRLIRG
jgi:hypothetical protein